ncbi:MAG: glycosyltransferase family 2 protein [Aequorivita sp.]
MPKPLVSIIIPTFNRAHLIGETLDSVLAQTYQNWECIVVDDGSTDNTDEVMAEYMAKDARFQYHHRPEDRLPGGNAARNYGFEVSSGQFVQWFDDDDIMLARYLKQKISIFTPEAQFIICSGTYVSENLERLEDIEYQESIDLFKDYILWNLKVFTPSVLFRKSFLENKELFNLSIQRGQETEFFSRVFFEVSAEEYGIINEPLFLYRQHVNTKSIRNKTYKETYALSKGYINIENLKRGLLINDVEIIRLYYIRLINLLFKSIYRKDNKTSMFILGKLSQILKKRRFQLYVELTLIGNYLIHYDTGRYFFHQRWKKFDITPKP